MDQRNLVLAVVLSVSILLIWQVLFEQPRMEKERARQQAQQQTAGQQQPSAVPSPQAPVPGAPGAGVPPMQPPTAGAPGPAPAAPVAGQPAKPAAPARAAVIGATPRIGISSRRLEGSIRLAGGLIDDLTLSDYRESIGDDARIHLLSPIGAPSPYYARMGWIATSRAVPVPDDRTPWTAAGRTLSPERPVTLRWDNGKGLVFERVIALDANYMFTVTQRVHNGGTTPVTLSPYGLISRSGTPKTLGYYILHEGPLGVFDGTLSEVKYTDLAEEGQIRHSTTGGWIGITDKYWLTALVPDQKARVETRFLHRDKEKTADKTEKYQVDFVGGARTVAPGTTVEVSNRLFAGAKEVRLLEAYADKPGIVRFDLAVDWGWFQFLTKPIFYVLEYFHRMLGNFGLAILLLTVLIKLAFFPLANKSYKAMSRLKQLQPKMTELRERYPDDRAKQNEAMMKLYKDENANPMSGCMPMLIQIPVFFALYKVLFVSIEMRQAPFYGWIHDLSVRDPTSVFNLFGLIAWTPPHFLLIGAWPLIMGATMFLQQKLNPAPADPVQAKIFMFLPIVFTVILAPFPAGLVIYWAWNNTLSIAQQWVIMRRMGVGASGQTTARGRSAGKAGASGKAKASASTRASTRGKAAGKRRGGR